jgi:esterase/lipase superfamily enzyme
MRESSFRRVLALASILAVCGCLGGRVKDEMPPKAEAPRDEAPPPMAAPPDSGFEHVPVHFATNREPQGLTDFGPGRGAGVTYGRCVVSIPEGHRIGEIERPAWWKLEFREDPTRHVVVLSIDVTPKATFLEDLRRTVAASSRRAALVFVHGYNVTFQDAARRTAQMAHDLTFPGPSVFFSWPSQGAVAKYTFDETNVEWSERHMREFFDDVASRLDADALYVVAHSMGNRAATRALADLLADKPELRPKFKEIILAAPDIDADVFKSSIAPALVTIGAPITLYASSNDLALRASKTVHGYPRAGEAGASILVIDGIETVDTSVVETDFLGHSAYGDSDVLLADLFHVIHNNLRASQRARLRVRQLASGRYWDFTP